MTYIKELDAIRAFAIITVVINHWSQPGTKLNYISGVIEAPNIFFTISAFLITKILLNDRLKAEKITISKLTLYKNFFFKRALRIFPAYYFIIFVTYLIEKNSFLNRDYLSCLSFTSNFYIAYHKDWGYLAHLWSMAVEQQFYLFWPLLIFFVRTEYLPYAIGLCVIVGIVSQNLLSFDVEGYSKVLPHTVLDTLGLGALLAWVVTFKPHSLDRVYKVLVPAAAVSSLLIVCQEILGNFSYLHNRTLIAIITATLIAHFIKKSNSSTYPLSFLFRNKYILLVGKISYGIYIYHLTLFSYLYKFIDRINAYLPKPIQYNQHQYVAVCLLLLFCLAWFSWKYVELPISNLKKYVEYKSLSPAQSSLS